MAQRRAPSFPRRRFTRWLVPSVVLGALAIPTAVRAQTDSTTSEPPPTIEVTTTPPVVTQTPTTVAPVVIPASTVPPIIVPDPTVAAATTSTAVVAVAETTTTVDPSATTTSVGSTTSTLLPVINEDDFAEEVSIDQPPPAFRPVLPPSLVIPPRNITLEKAIARLTEQQRRIVDEAQKQADAATERIAAAQQDLDRLLLREDELKLAGLKLAQAKEATAIKVRLRALRLYAGEAIGDLDVLLRSQDANELARNIDIIGAAQKRDAELLAEFREDQKALDDNAAELATLTEAKRVEIESLIIEQEVLTESLATLQEQLSFVISGQAIAVGGFVFPVGAPFNFASTFGAPRMTGTKYEHTHQGNDIFATSGTPLYATSRGVIARKAVAVLGGNKLWLVAADGTQYYYAHLAAYADGIEDGSIVEAGQVIGYVGDTGNARGTPPHLHFEIHPAGGPAIDPYPILDAVRRSDSTRLLTAAKALAVTTTTAPPPGSGNAGIGVIGEFAIGEVDASAAGPRSTSTTVDPKPTSTAAAAKPST